MLPNSILIFLGGDGFSFSFLTYFLITFPLIYTLKIFLIFGRLLGGHGFVVIKLLYDLSHGVISSILKLIMTLLKRHI